MERSCAICNRDATARYARVVVVLDATTYKNAVLCAPCFGSATLDSVAAAVEQAFRRGPVPRG